MGNSCMKKNKIVCAIDNTEFDKLSKEHIDLQDKYLKLKKKYNNLENEHTELKESLSDNFVLIKTSTNKKKVF